MEYFWRIQCFPLQNIRSSVWDLDAFQVTCEFLIGRCQEKHGNPIRNRKNTDALLELQPGNHSVCIQSWLPYLIAFELETHIDHVNTSRVRSLWNNSYQPLTRAKEPRIDILESVGFTSKTNIATLHCTDWFKVADPCNGSWSTFKLYT